MSTPAKPEHTPEPWLTGQPEIGYTHDLVDRAFLHDDPNIWYAELPLADYRRAVACVNALAGIQDPSSALSQARKLAGSVMALTKGDRECCDIYRQAEELLRAISPETKEEN